MLQLGATGRENASNTPEKPRTDGKNDLQTSSEAIESKLPCISWVSNQPGNSGNVAAAPNVGNEYRRKEVYFCNADHGETWVVPMLSAIPQ
jgi:hypothetical protein